MTRQRLGRILLAFSIIATVVIVAIADVFNATHLFNPDWPGHARFHIGMQFTTLLLLSAASFWALLSDIGGERLWVAALAPATFWAGLFVAWAIPGTDAYASEALRQLGIPINIILAGLFIVLTAVGYRMAARRTKATQAGPAHAGLA